MITGDSTIKVGLPVSAVFGVLAWVFTWVQDNVVTKDDFESLQAHQQESYIELSIQLTELHLTPYEDGRVLTPQDARKYDLLKERLQRLEKEKDRLVQR